MSRVEITCPDIGNFSAVEIIEVLVQSGDTVNAEQSLITLESDKASMDIPCPQGGVVEKVLVKVGDKISQGTPILTLNAAEAPVVEAPTATPQPPAQAPAAAPTPAPTDGELHAEVMVLGAGPGGYTAAFRAADLGKKVILVERYPDLGGVCLNVGCIPSKALLHTAKVITEAEEMAQHGVTFAKPSVDLAALRHWKAHDVVAKLTGGLAGLAKARHITVVHGIAAFTSPHTLAVQSADGSTRTIRFDNAIIAAGSHATPLPGAPDDPRIIDSTGALALTDIPSRMLVIGGGIIGLEMGTVYDALGSRVTVFERGDGLIPGCDRDLVRPLQKRMEGRFEKIILGGNIDKLEAKKDGIHAHFAGEMGEQVYDRVLVSIGRRPNGRLIGADTTGVYVDDYGFIPVDKQMRTNVPHIFAIGDIVGQPMLAHKAVHEGKVAAEVIAGHKVEFQALVIPSVAYTDPEIAWVGLNETEAKAKGIAIEKQSFPWAASGRALSIARTEGSTKMIIDPETHRVLGVGIVGTNAGELLAEACLAIEMGAVPEDIGLTIHAHPTLSETIGFAAEMLDGTITDMMPPKKK